MREYLSTGNPLRGISSRKHVANILPYLGKKGQVLICFVGGSDSSSSLLLLAWGDFS